MFPGIAQLLRQRAFLRDERRRLRIATDKVEERKNALTVMRRADWLPESLKTADPNEKHVLINIGGLVSCVKLFCHHRPSSETHRDHFL